VSARVKILRLAADPQPPFYEVTAEEVAAAVDITEEQAANWLDRLEREGFLKRSRLDAWRITDVGRALLPPRSQKPSEEGER
jgi:predicted ArsR family transcriptional regulator